MTADSAPAPDGVGRIGRSRHDAARLGIVIVAFRCDDVLRVCLDSIHHEGSRGVEVVVVDNGSCWSTQQLVQGYGAGVRYVDPGENLGFSRANNVGAAAVRADYLLFLNPDTIVPHGALSLVVAEITRRPEVGILGCKLTRADGSFDHAAKRGLPTPGASLAYFLRLDRLLPRWLGGYQALWLDSDATGVVDSVNGAFMLMRSDTFRTVGGFDEDYWMFGEDLDLCVRVMTQLGLSTLYWPGAEITHLKGGVSAGRASKRVNIAFFRSMRIFFDKHLAATTSPVVRALVRTGIESLLVISTLVRRLQAMVAFARRWSRTRPA